uniref:G-protein coupled receptors family 1 profile domain-containing protein n=1 Tax=Globodera rostochiensis TaxID=31243 RepID=A0A914I353_GLORO
MEQIEGLNVNYSYYQLWAEYKDVGPSTLLIFTAALLNLVVVPGIFMNIAIIFVTIKYRSLHGTSSFLLALTAVYETIHEFGHLYFLWVSASGRNFVSYFTVFKFLALPLVGCTASLASIALTGLDRFFQMAFSKWHGAVNRTVYLGTFVLISLAFGLLMGLKYAQVAFAHPEWPQTGTISDIFLFEFKPIFFSYMLLANFISIGFYAAVWGAFKWEKSKSAVSNNETHLFKSLAVIISISIGSYLITAVVRLFLLPLMHLDQVQVWFVELYFGILLNVGVALNAPVLYICSNEYRKCFVREFALLAQRSD